MMRSRVVFNRVLNELKSRQADSIKRQVIRAAGVRDRKRLRAEIPEGREPLPEQRPHRFVALEIDAANFSGAIVEVEISVKLFVFGRGHQFRRRSRLAVRSSRWHDARIARLKLAKML